MTREVFRYTFGTEVPMNEVELSLVLALMATECLHGEAKTRLEARHHLDTERRMCVVSSSSDAGRHFCTLFTGFVTREFGPESFQVERVEAKQPQRQEVAA